MPPRIRRRRTKGWRLPEGAVICDRTSRWGNPHRATDPWDERWRTGWWPMPPEGPLGARGAALMFREYMGTRLKREPGWLDPLRTATALACTCPLDSDCHVDVIRDWLEHHPVHAREGEPIVFGIHRMADAEAEGAPAWPSEGTVATRARERYQRWVRREVETR